MKKLYLIVLFLAFTAVHYAFAQAVATGGRVNGKLVDASTGEAVDFATIALFPIGGDKMAKGTSSADGGNFAINNIPYGAYTVQITFVGYEKFLLDSLVLNDERAMANMGVIKLKPAGGALAEVVIGDRKKTVEYNADQITYNVAESINAEGSTATDILKNVPMVQVDVDGNATIAGKRSTRIFIDGKPSDFMTSNISDLLSVLPSDAIEKIEVMTNPPAKYSADGEGIINVVLKKGYKVGMTGTLAATAGTLGDYNLNSYGSYKTQKYAINSSYGFSGRYNINNSYNLRQNNFADTLFYRNNYRGQDQLSLGHNARIGGNWDIDSINSVRFNTNFNINNSNASNYNNRFYLDENAEQSRLDKQLTTRGGSSMNYSADFSYVWRGGRKGQVEISGNFSMNRSSNFDAQNTAYLDANGLPMSNKRALERMLNNFGNNHSVTLKADYSRSLGTKADLSLGLDASLRNIDNGQEASNLNFATQQYIISQDLTNNFGFGGDIYSLYSGLGYRTKTNWSFRAQARAELTNMSFDLSAMGQPFYIKPYINVFPNFSISKNFKQKYMMGISFGERIQRPRENTLNPTIDTRDSMNISFGNPNLSPSFTRQIDLSFGWFESMWSIYPKFGYSTTRGIIERITTVSSNGQAQSTYDNLSNSDNYTFNLFGNYRFSKKVNFHGSGTIGNVRYRSDVIRIASRNGFTFNTNAGLSVELPKKLMFEGNMSYSKSTVAQGRVTGTIATNFGLRKTMLRNKVKMRVSVNNPFAQNGNLSYIEGVNFNSESLYTRNTRNFSLTLSYNFSQVGKSRAEKKMDAAKPAMQKAAAGGGAAKPF
ncbi:outer membrane beta-barrel family protein [Mucilaginibacter myungsuensis]|uniref:Outer membrane beta-barrel protein n=1 Tax=Mucilaginibacter myungsuensis TaxID=649104 RepID=A0A929PYP7_9SPHI|nr:outer membrane beta-barrel family protein [Mucilaginibacter myungsuensis]MBE9663547.1 outer membrane beta-barrel protein [Mucilaginibacter myungsuensis]MDN3600285.1 outer membrane beta-barrel family protein [Mucilaginibacter myungsuensis]